ncbi:MAG: hypothetical protein JNM56_19995, partial [Planctomycetia bacterium]|nr:hypothetical protein [Planctomycetia bacterium]
MNRKNRRSRAQSGLGAMRRALARYRAEGQVPVVVQLDNRCAWGRAAAQAFAPNTRPDPEQHAMLREETATGIVCVEEAMAVLGDRPCEVNPQQWEALDLDRVVQTLAPDTRAVLRLPLPAPWFFVALVQDDQLTLAVVPDLPSLDCAPCRGVDARRRGWPGGAGGRSAGEWPGRGHPRHAAKNGGWAR